MTSTKILKRFLLAVTMTTLASPALSAGAGNACAVKSAANIRASGLIEEYSLYSSAMEKSAAAVFRYLKDPNYSLGGPLDLANTSSGGAVRSSVPAETKKPQPTVRDVASEMTKPRRNSNKSAL